MKKFMTIAMIVLAAAMLVVSCDANKKADVDHSVLVNASIGVSESKAITVPKGDGAIAKIVVTIAPMWKEVDSNEPIEYGKADGKHQYIHTSATDPNFLNFNLGYISQGQWNVKVQAYNTGETVIYDNTEAGNDFFFTVDANTKTIKLEENTTGSVSFKVGATGIVTPTLKNTTATDTTMASEYKIVVTIDGDAEKIIELTSGTDSTTTPTDAKTTWTSSDTLTLKSGSHSYSVTLVDTRSGEKIVGGVAGTFFATKETTEVALTGSMNPADFAKSDLKIIADDLAIKFTADKTTATDAQSVTYTVAKASGQGTIKTVDFYVDGVKQNNNNQLSLTVSSFKPGYHHVSVVVNGTKAGADLMTKVTHAE